MYKNLFLEFVKEVKKAYEERIGKCSYEGMESEKKRNATCLNRWVNELKDPYFMSVLSGLSLQQYKTYIIAHYNDLFCAADEDGNEIGFAQFFYVHDSLYKECRGIVVDVEKEELVLMPFKKFFNLEELPEVSLENVRKRLENAKCVEFSNKLDGSMISAGVYNGEVVASGSSCNDPSVSVQVLNSLKYIKEHKNYEKLLWNYPGDTHIFEHIFPTIDPHVVNYNQMGLYLIGIRNKETGEEYSYDVILKRAKEYGILTTEVYQVSLDDVIQNLDAKAATEAEGFVMNVDGYRVKIKYDDYVLMHRTIANTASYNGIIVALDKGTLDDIIAKIPDAYKQSLIDKAKEVTHIVEEIDRQVMGYANRLPDRDKKCVMVWINQNVPKKYQGCVREVYYGRKPEYLKKRAEGYHTMKELQEWLTS